MLPVLSLLNPVIHSMNQLYYISVSVKKRTCRDRRPFSL